MPNKKKNPTIDFSKLNNGTLPVRPTLPEVKLPRDFNPLWPRPPTSILFIAGSGMGKTSAITNICFRDPEMYGGIYEKILIISPTVEDDQSTQPFLAEEMEDIVTIRNDPQNMDEIVHNYIAVRKEQYDIKDPDKPDPPLSLIILDDISGYLKRTNDVVHLISRNRHYNTSLIISNQTCRDLPRPVRTLTKAVMLARTTSMIEQKAILEEWGGKFEGGEQQMMEVWDEATKEKYNFLYMNFEDASKPRFFQWGKDGMFEFENLAAENPEEGPMGGPDEPDEVDPLKEEQPLHCDTCNQSFKTPDRLRRHEMTKRHQKAAGNF